MLKNINMHNDLTIAKDLLRIRLSQMIINEKLKNNEFRIPIHLAFGHEAIAVAVSVIMGSQDQLVLSHRNVHYNLARSSSFKAEVDEYLLKKEGLGGGRLGSMNLANREGGIIYTSSILGNNLCVSAGLALAKKVKKENGLVIVVTGDGAIEEGAFYESLEFLKTYNLSSLIIVENNGWSLATQIHERRCNICLDSLTRAFDIPFRVLDGNDPYKYIDILKDIYSIAIKKQTPVIIEVRLKTLGDWRLKSEEFPEGKFINYHAGPAPTIKLSEWPMISEDRSDPVFVLSDHIRLEKLKEISRDVLNKLVQELK